MPRMSNPTVFISYSHKDEEWKDRIAAQLAVLEHEGILEEWDDRKIGGGDEWYEQIQQAMDRACVAILLVSADFLNSDFIRREEVPKLLQRREQEGLRVFPVIVWPCPWQHVKWLARMQVRPRDGRPLSAGNEHQIRTDLAEIASEIAAMVARAAPRGGDDPTTSLGPDKIALAKLPSTSPDLFGRDDELAMLDKGWADPKTNVISFVAWGGVGKTALVNKWLLQMREGNYRGAEGVYGHSFYSQGAREGTQVSADEFIAAALTWFGDDDPTQGSPWDKGERLAELVSRQRTLLVLDGVEPLQYPPGEMKGRLKDPGLQSLLRELAQRNPGLCIVTTRLPVDDLKDFIGTSAIREDLEDLSSDAGAALLEHLRVKGTPEELKEATKEVRGHALALTLLGQYLVDVYDADIRKRDKIEKLIDEDEQGAHAKNVMAAYARWFQGKPESDILHIMGLFDRPAQGDAVEAVKQSPPIAGLTDRLQDLSHAEWQFALKHLRRAKLLADADPQSPDTLDCHPLIREYFGDQLKTHTPDAWTAAHSRLYEHYKALPEKEFPDTLEEMAPLYAAVAHGCRAGRHQEALLVVYWARICRGNQAYSTHKLGAIGTNLAALSGFFDQPWSRPVRELGEADASFVLGTAGYYLRSLGRLAEAAGLLQACLDAYVGLKNWKNAAISANNISQLHVMRGLLDAGRQAAEQSLEFADRSGDALQRTVNRTTLADALHQMGRLQEAEAAFREAEEMQKTRQSECPLLYSFQGFQYCDLLLTRGEYGDAHRRALQAMEWVTARGRLQDIGLDNLSLGRALLLRARDGQTDDLDDAATHLDRAVDGLRDAGVQEFVARGLLGRAELCRCRRKFERAKRDLDEATTIAERGGMRLHEADCHLEHARLYMAMDKKDEARTHLTTAREMIEEMGYHRPDAEVLIETARLQRLDGDTSAARRTLATAKKRVDEMGCHRWDVDVRELG